MKKTIFMTIMSACLLICISAFLGCDLNNFKDYYLDEKSFNAESLRMVEQRIGIVFPPGSRGLNMFYAGARSIDPAFLARIEIPESSYAELAANIERIRNSSIGLGGNSLTEEVVWWNPKAENIHIERNFTPDGSYVHVLLCHENDQWILYVEFYQV